jgi:hypothetical protein
MAMFNPSNPFDFSGMNLLGMLSSDLEPRFGMDQYWSDQNTLGVPLDTPSHAALPTTQSNPTLYGLPDPPLALPTLNDLMSTTADGFIAPNNAHSALPIQNNLISTTVNGFIAPNNAYSVSNTAMYALDNSMLNAPTLPTQHNLMSTTVDGFVVPDNTHHSALNTATNALPSGVTEGACMEGNDKSKKRKTYEERNAHCILPEGARRGRKKARRTQGAEDENTPAPKKRNANKGNGSSKRK